MSRDEFGLPGEGRLDPAKYVLTVAGDFLESGVAQHDLYIAAPVFAGIHPGLVGVERPVGPVHDVGK